MAAGRNRYGGSAPSRPPIAPESWSARVPAASPLPDTSTTATSSRLPSVRVVATTKSPANGEPPAEDRADSTSQFVRQLRDRALRQDPVAQVDEHRLAPPLTDPERRCGGG